MSTLRRFVRDFDIFTYLTIFSVAAMSWMAEYILFPLVMNRFTAFGRSVFGVVKALRKLILVKETEQSGSQLVMKVALNTYSTYAPLSVLATIRNHKTNMH